MPPEHHQMMNDTIVNSQLPVGPIAKYGNGSFFRSLSPTNLSDSFTKLYMDMQRGSGRKLLKTRILESRGMGGEDGKFSLEQHPADTGPATREQAASAGSFGISPPPHTPPGISPRGSLSGSPGAISASVNSDLFGPHQQHPADTGPVTRKQDIVLSSEKIAELTNMCDQSVSVDNDERQMPVASRTKTYSAWNVFRNHQFSCNTCKVEKTLFLVG